MAFEWSGLVANMGRVLRIGGQPRMARRARGEGWRDDVAPSLRGLGRLERAALAEAWSTYAALEHASVPAFGRVAEALIALGAPSELVERTHLAALDALRHARRCYALASAYGGDPRRPGELPELRARVLDERRPRLDALAHLAFGSLVDGALSAGVAATVAEEVSLLATDPVVRATWELVADDESRHAELAWDTIAWCLGEGGGTVASALEAAIAALPGRALAHAPALPVADARLERLGVATQARLDRATRATVETAIARTRALVEAKGGRKAA
jgi:hypothetical protein